MAWSQRGSPGARSAGRLSPSTPTWSGTDSGYTSTGGSGAKSAARRSPTSTNTEKFTRRRSQISHNEKMRKKDTPNVIEFLFKRK